MVSGYVEVQHLKCFASLHKRVCRIKSHIDARPEFIVSRYNNQTAINVLSPCIWYWKSSIDIQLYEYILNYLFKSFPFKCGCVLFAAKILASRYRTWIQRRNQCATNKRHSESARECFLHITNTGLRHHKFWVYLYLKDIIMHKIAMVICCASVGSFEAYVKLS